MARRRRFESVLRPLGLWESFAAMPRHLQQMFWKFKLPDPAVVFDEAAAAPPPGMRAAAERYLQQASVTLDDGLKLPVRDFIGVVTGAMEMCQFLNGSVAAPPAGMPEQLKAFAQAAGPVLERCHLAHLQAAWDAMYRGVMSVVVHVSRMDTRLFNARIDAEPNERGRRETRVTVCTAEPQVAQVLLDGSARQMFRAAQIGKNSADVQWVSWDPAVLDSGPAGRRALPVYVQSHALRRLQERLPLVGAWRETWLADSLAEPNVVERCGGDDLLVEFRVNKYRLGYLVVTPARVCPARADAPPDCVAVRTFKFITMENTPESRELKRRLRLARRDVDWLHLHEMESFTHTDLRTDPLLRRLLEQCGCGHLFRLAEEHDFAPHPKPLAGEVRKYLRMAA